MKSMKIVVGALLLILMLPAGADAQTNVTNAVTNAASPPAATTTADPNDTSAASINPATMGTASVGSASNGNTRVDQLIAQVTTSNSCWVCRFVDDLSVQADSYGGTISASFAAAVYTTWRDILIVGVLWYFLLVLVRGKVELQEIFMKGAMAIVVTYVLKQAEGGQTGWFWMNVYIPLRNVCTNFATQLVTGTSGVTVPSQWQSGSQTQALTGPYSPLFGTIEHTLFRVILSAWKIATVPSTWIGIPNLVAGFLNIVAALFMLFPWVVIVTIFGAYIVEAMFAFLAVNCIMPALFICFFFEKARSFFWIGMRVMLGAGLTLVFAGIAMGFTLSAVMKYEADLEAAIAAGNDYVVFQMPYWVMMFVGLISIILHLKAKGLASNFSGASDGAGPAAAAATLVGGFAGLGGKRLAGAVFSPVGKGAKKGSEAIVGATLGRASYAAGYGGAAIANAAGQIVKRMMNRR